MSDNPLETTPETEAHIKERARHLWEADGSPAGREDEYHERADELVRMEMAGNPGQLPNPVNSGNPIPGGIGEEAASQANSGEIPGRLTDQGDVRQPPMTRDQLRHDAADEEPDRGDAP